MLQMADLHGQEGVHGDQRQVAKVHGLGSCRWLLALYEPSAELIKCRLEPLRTVSFASSLSHTSKKYFEKSSSEIGAPLMRIRSLTATRCGDVYSPVRTRV